MALLQRGPVGLITRWAGGLRFPQLLLLTAVVFVADLIVPDMIPLVDEILLGLGTILFARWRKRRPTPAQEAPTESQS